VGGRGVRVFHISDLHMRSVDGPQADRARLEAASRWRVLGETWEANLAELRKDGVPFDLVVFTGDRGDWGHATDYPRALAFLKQTCAALDVPASGSRSCILTHRGDADLWCVSATPDAINRGRARQIMSMNIVVGSSRSDFTSWRNIAPSQPSARR
jgi:hypothetical protein